tara:strand:+ start:12 stop:125 length:114 start_codon:yes stop_codon:yes gene_type:complete
VVAEVALKMYLLALVLAVVQADFEKLMITLHQDHRHL